MPKEHQRHAAPLTLIAASLVATIACTDVGDTSAVPSGDDTGSLATPDSTLNPAPDVGGSDTTIPAQDGGDATTSMADVGFDANQGNNSNNTALGNPPGESDAGMAGPTPKASVPDAEAPDSSSEDSSSSLDGPVEEAAADALEEVTLDAAHDADTTLTDAGGGDASTDSGGADTTVADASDASQEADVGAADAGSDSGGLTPCTSAPCGADTVPCDGNANHNNVCTPTEALIVARDIAKGNVSSGKLTMSSCYECILAIGCIDDDQFSSDVNHECGDLSTSAVALDGESYSQACLDTLSCMIDQKCTTGNPPAACFCGTASTATCFVTKGAANGVCLNQEVNGLPKVSGASCTMGSFASGGTPPTCTPGDLTASDNDYIDSTEPSGMANTLMGCAYSNCQSECTP